MICFDFFHTSIGRKAVMAVTGIGLGAFIMAHAVGASTTLFGRAALTNYAGHLHDLGILLHGAELGLLGLFVLHIFLGVSLYLENRRARPIPLRIKKDSPCRSWGAKTMPWTGLFILLFVLVHLNNFHFTDQTAPLADTVRNTLQRPVLAIFYITAMLALIFHISHGFWSLFQSLGLNHPSYAGLLRKATLTLSIGLGLLFLLIPLTALICHTFLK